MSELVFAEFQEDVDALLRYSSEQSRVVIALDVGCVAPLRRRGVPFHYAHEFVGSARLQALTTEWEARVLDLEGALGGALGRVGAGDQADLVEVFLKHLKVLHDTTRAKAMQLEAILREVAPERVWYAEPRSGHFDSRMTFDERESVYGHLLKRVFAPLGGISFRSCACAASPAPQRFRHSARHWFGPVLDRVEACQEYRMGRSPGSGRPMLLVAERGYGLDDVLPGLRRHFDLVVWRGRSAISAPEASLMKWLAAIARATRDRAAASRALARVWAEISRDPGVRRSFRLAELDLFPVVEDRIERMAVLGLASAQAMRETARRYLARNPRVSAFFTVNFSLKNPWTYPVALACRERGIPVITYQHSAFGYFHWPYSKYVDEVMADHRLVWAEGPSDYMRSVEPTGCTAHVVGSLEMARLRTELGRAMPFREDPWPRRVVYAISSYVKNGFYLAHHRMLSTEYNALHHRVLTVLAREAKGQVVVKLHPSQDEAFRLLAEWVEAQGSANLTCVRGERFSDFLPTTDLVILDSPSTTLVQAALSPARILLLTGVYKIVDAARPSLEARAEVHDDVSGFLRAVAEVTSGRRAVRSDPRDERFSRRYGAGSEEGPCAVADRVVEALVGLARPTEDPGFHADSGA